MSSFMNRDPIDVSRTLRVRGSSMMLKEVYCGRYYIFEVLVHKFFFSVFSTKFEE